MRPTRSARRAFTIVPIAFALWIILLILGLFLYNQTPPPGYIPSKSIGPGQPSAIYGALLIGLFWIYVCSRVAERRGQVWANVTAAFVFGLACLGWTITLAGWTKDLRNLKKPIAATTPATPTPIPPAPQPTAPSTPIASNPAPTPPDAPADAAPPDAGPSDTAPAPMTVAPSPPTSHPPRPPAAAKPPIDTASAIAAVEDPIVASLTDLIDKSDKLLPELAKRPPHEIRIVNERLARIKSFKESAEALKMPLEAAQTELKLRLMKLGMSEGDAHFESFKRINQVFNVTQRKFGIDALVRLCDKATEEHEFLRDNIAKWSINAKGELTSKDISFKQKADSNHFFVKADADRRDSINNQLRGK